MAVGGERKATWPLGNGNVVFGLFDRDARRLYLFIEIFGEIFIFNANIIWFKHFFESKF